MGLRRSIACTQVGGAVALVGFLAGSQAYFDASLAIPMAPPSPEAIIAPMKPACRPPPDLISEPDDSARCRWCASSPAYSAYPDEWGVPVADDHRLFDELHLEGFQTGPEELT